MTRVLLTEVQFTDACDEILELVARLRLQHTTLRRRHAQNPRVRRDGYPTRSMNRSAPGNVLDDEGIPMPPRSDPVGELVVDQDEHDVVDPVHDALAAVVALTNDARRKLEQAECEAARAEPPKTMVVSGDDVWCAHHLEHRMFEPLGAKARRGLCGWCESFERTYAMKPPPALLRIRAERGKVMPADVKRALGAKIL